MSDELEEVERPSDRREMSIAAQLRRTADTGNALLLPNRRTQEISGGFHAGLRAHGFRLHVKRDGPDVIAWCERIVPNGHTPGPDVAPKGA